MNVRLGRVLRMVREARFCARGSWERMVGRGCGLVSCDTRSKMGIEMVFWNLRFGDAAFSFNGVYLVEVTSYTLYHTTLCLVV